MPYISNLEAVLPVLHAKLPEYLSLKLGMELNYKSRFPCFLHKGENDNMGFNAKTGETVHCFSCNRDADIFSAASELDGLPSSGPQWVMETVPALCKLLSVPFQTGEPSPIEAERLRLWSLARDIAEVIQGRGAPQYAEERDWVQEDLIVGQIPEEELYDHLVRKGWEALDISRSLLVKTSTLSFFGPDKVTFVIKDERGRPCGFLCRNLSGRGPKYINSPESPVYQKGKILLGLDTALQSAKGSGLYVVEGPGDLAQLKRLGVTNSAATCGTALTVDHLLLLKAHGIRHVHLCLDWDEAGTTATDRIFFNILKQVPGFVVDVVMKPKVSTAKDVDELLKGETNPQVFLELERIPAFAWVISKLSDNEPADVVCGKLIPIIAAEPTAVKREILTKQLSEFTSLSYLSIMNDVNAIRNNKFEERRDRLLAAADQYRRQVGEDPDNIISIMSSHEGILEKIEKEYNRDLIGPSYQVSRYNAIQDLRAVGDDSATAFKMKWFKEFAEMISGGANWTTGCLMYAGGKAHSGKTLTCTTIAADVAMSDPDTITIVHSIDDSYTQIEPRLKSIIARMLYPTYPRLSLGMIVNPKTGLVGFGMEYQKALKEADETFRSLLADDKLILIDGEDGESLSTLEKNVRYYRQHYPSKKLLLVLDNTHDVNDHPGLDQHQRITQIAKAQKSMTIRYHACMIATAEYRKSQPKDPTKLVMPIDDDLADARALTFKPNVIFHVYNDLKDRKEHASIYHLGENNERHSRLILNFSKNKMSGKVGDLVVDVDPISVTITPVDSERAMREAARHSALKEDGKLYVSGGKVFIDADEFEEET